MKGISTLLIRNGFLQSPSQFATLHSRSNTNSKSLFDLFYYIFLSLNQKINVNKKDPTHVLFSQFPQIQILSPSSFNGYIYLSLPSFSFASLSYQTLLSLISTHILSLSLSLEKFFFSLWDLCSRWSTSCYRETRSWGRQIPPIQRRRRALAPPSHARLGSLNRPRRMRRRSIWPPSPPNPSHRRLWRPNWRVHCRRGHLLQVLTKGSSALSPGRRTRLLIPAFRYSFSQSWTLGFFLEILNLIFTELMFGCLEIEGKERKSWIFIVFYDHCFFFFFPFLFMRNSYRMRMGFIDFHVFEFTNIFS